MVVGETNKLISRFCSRLMSLNGLVLYFNRTVNNYWTSHQLWVTLYYCNRSGVLVNWKISEVTGLLWAIIILENYSTMTHGNWSTIQKNYEYNIVIEYAKGGLIRTSIFSTLRLCNSACAWPTALKFGSRTFLSLHLYDRKFSPYKQSYATSRLHNWMHV